ncbi:histidine protein methyltransferase [Rhizoctonia solani]|uniref:Histidine protein methyltransferase n=1 Tax=Rhizoctonia solani TaxID=456999 RepID=A0A8H8P0S0_9AGAM|nr:histidine protein methyltransferase [Rhizoctonia solani]QRW23626.1 histidine protein methyltransferase [Rhizoctonia solani]
MVLFKGRRILSSYYPTSISQTDSKSKLPEVSNLTLESVLKKTKKRHKSDLNRLEHIRPPRIRHDRTRRPCIPPALRSAFQDSLSTHHIELRFFSDPGTHSTPKRLRPRPHLGNNLPTHKSPFPRSLAQRRDLSRREMSRCGQDVYFGVGGGIRELKLRWRRVGRV